MGAPFSARFALRNALQTLWGGIIALGLYLLVITFGPGIEGRYFPVVTDYRLVGVRHMASGGISFEPQFTKARDCTYYGSNWFAPDERGNLVRIQTRRANTPQEPPVTGPTGPRVGERQHIVPPEDATEIYAIMHHDCGFLWQTRTQIGPFAVEDGRLIRPRPRAVTSPVRSDTEIVPAS